MNAQRVVTPFQTFQKFNAWKLHFTREGYDIIKYNGKFKADIDKFNTRSDKYFYQKLSKKKDLDFFLLANMLEDPNIWVGDIFSDSCERRYTAWLKRQQSLSYTFMNDLKSMNDDFNSNFKSIDGQHPPLLVMYRRGEITIETLTILSELVGFIPSWNKNMDDTIVWPGIYLTITKYKPFIKYDKNKFQGMMKKRWIDDK